MFKLLGKPLIHHVIDVLKEAELKNYIIVVGHHGEQIKNYLKDGSKLGVNIQYTTQNQSLGMADALKTTEKLIDDNWIGHQLFVNVSRPVSYENSVMGTSPSAVFQERVSLLSIPLRTASASVTSSRE